MASRSRIIACLLVASAPLGTTAQQTRPQESTILIGGLNVRLGADQGDTLRQLGTVYDLRHNDNAPGTWGVVRKSGVHDVVGVVAFTNQKVTMANKNWGPDVQSASRLAQVLHEAVTIVYSGQRDSCSVSAATIGTIGVQTDIQCGRRRLSVVGFTDPGRSSIINESISTAY